MQINSIFLQIRSYRIWFSSIFQELLWDSFKGSYISCLVKVKASFYKKSRAMVWETNRNFTKEEMGTKKISQLLTWQTVWKHGHGYFGLGQTTSDVYI